MTQVAAFSARTIFTSFSNSALNDPNFLTYTLSYRGSDMSIMTELQSMT